jgi:hypothetical protein
MAIEHFKPSLDRSFADQMGSPDGMISRTHGRPERVW